jgi:hypothetical protein
VFGTGLNLTPVSHSHSSQGKSVSRSQRRCFSFSFSHRKVTSNLEGSKIEYCSCRDCLLAFVSISRSELNLRGTILCWVWGVATNNYGSSFGVLSHFSALLNLLGRYCSKARLRPIVQNNPVDAGSPLFMRFLGH